MVDKYLEEHYMPEIDVYCTSTCPYCQRAEKLLKVAARNKGGHRWKALVHVRKAIKEVKEGMSHANNK